MWGVSVAVGVGGGVAVAVGVGGGVAVAVGGRGRKLALLVVHLYPGKAHVCECI